MVLQRGRETMLCGFVNGAVTAETLVHAEVRNAQGRIIARRSTPLSTPQGVSATAPEQGEQHAWFITMPPITRDDPCTVQVWCDGGNETSETITIEDVVFGEVWLVITDGLEGSSDAAPQGVRVPQPASSEITQTSWSQPATLPDVVAEFVVALHERTDVPVGLLPASREQALQMAPYSVAGVLVAQTDDDEIAAWRQWWDDAAMPVLTAGAGTTGAQLVEQAMAEPFVEPNLPMDDAWYERRIPVSEPDAEDLV
ncbi:hypothetical protein BIFGAL_04068 [Bifidobacterium gallicum DSM 20093 = LMG 11596]|nr:hypothetical protein BIFGAL_04068 [Bifidobacterium gallicum DSM 20093 = LMG 11596]